MSMTRTSLGLDVKLGGKGTVMDIQLRCTYIRRIFVDGHGKAFEMKDDGRLWDMMYLTIIVVLDR
jgi:hypothetical protein